MKKFRSTLSSFAPYSWSFKNKTISLICPTSTPVSKKDIQISMTSIRTPYFFGTWFKEISFYDIVIQPNQFTVNITADFHWPILLVGPEIDDYSNFLIFHFLRASGKDEEAKKFLISNCSQNKKLFFISAQVFFQEARQPLQNIYFLIKYFQIAHDDAALLDLAKSLIEDSFDGMVPKIAENILIDLAKRKNGEAFYLLGHLYSTDGFNNSAIRIQYLTTAAYDFQKS